MTPGWDAFHKFPSLIIAILVGVGIVVGSHLPPSFLTPLAGILAGAILLAGVLLWLHSGAYPAFTRSVCCVLLCTASGALKFLSDDTPSLLVSPSRVRTAVTLIGEVADAPGRTGNRLRFAFQVRSIMLDSLEVPCREKGIVTCAGTGESEAGGPIGYGTVLGVHGLVETPPAAGNPGEFSPRQYYAANGISFLMRVRGARNWRILDSSGGSFIMREVVIPLRQGILAEIDRDVGGDEGEFLKGLLIGERTGLSPGIRRAFLDSGVAHILAVSGSNVAVVAATIMMLLSLLRIPRMANRVMTACGLLLYMLITGSQPPVVRATIMALAMLLCSTLTRRVHPLNAVGVAALMMFAIDARQAYDVGFQLSFGAVLAILVISPRLLAVMQRNPGRTVIARLISQVCGVIAVSVAASIGTLPLTAIVFGRLSIVGLAANLVIVPASGIAVVLGMTSAAVAPVSMYAAQAYAIVNRILLMLTIRGAEIAAAVPWATMDTVSFRPIDALPFYAGLACLLGIGYPAFARRSFVAFLLFADVALIWPGSGLEKITPGSCRLVMMDVGQGDAILLQSPVGGTLLVDTGPPSRDGSPWGTSVIPLLKRLGIHTLDAVVVTHPHDDHAGGLAHVSGSFNVRRIVAVPDVARALDSSRSLAGTLISRAFRGSVLGDSAYRCYIMFPDSASADSGGNANGRSIVAKVQYGQAAVLFMGDVEAREEEYLIERYGDFLKSDVLKAGHHGSKAGTSERFLASVRPDYALISVGRFNRFGHPARATLRRLEAAGVEVLRTDEDGAIVLRTNGTDWDRLEWR